MNDDLFLRAREADIEAVAGVKLWRAGRRLRGECPICGASKGKKADGAFSVDVRAGLWHCFGACNRGGDVILLESLIAKVGPREAAERLVASIGVLPTPGGRTESRREAPPDPAPRGASASERTAAAIWREARRAIGTPVETYLHGRLIRGWVLEAAIASLRFHPRAFWGLEDDERTRVFAPAMVGAIETPAGYTGGIHVTYLAADGRGKLKRAPAKRMWGPQKDADGRWGGAWLIGPRAAGPLICGEGIESSLSAAMLEKRRCRVVAALSLNALQGGWLADPYGRRDPDAPTPDPERPPFTWPLDGLDVAEVLIPVDRDMSPGKVKARRATGGSYDRILTADERARICAGLAVDGWRRANPQLDANRVRALAPGAGRDFNDELRERLFA